MTYAKIEELYKYVNLLPEPLASEVREFHGFRENYLNGQGDVIGGLLWMDEKAEKIRKIYKDFCLIAPGDGLLQ
jgi:hypothetical protein